MTVFMLTAILVKVDMEPLAFFTVTMVKIVIINSFGAVLQGSLFGMAGLLPASYTTPIMSGQGLAGTFAALAMICALASGSAMKDAAFGYFITACVVILFSVFSYEFYQHYQRRKSSPADYSEATSLNVMKKGGQSATSQQDVQNPVSMVTIFKKVRSPPPSPPHLLTTSSPYLLHLLTSSSLHLLTPSSPHLLLLHLLTSFISSPPHLLIPSPPHLLTSSTCFTSSPPLPPHSSHSPHLPHTPHLHFTSFTLHDVWVLAVSVCFTFTVTIGTFPAVTSDVKTSLGGGTSWELYFIPVCCFLLFNVCDWAGRSLTAVCMWPGGEGVRLPLLVASRAAFVPLFMLCNVQPRGGSLPVLFSHDALFILFMVLFAFSNGYLASLCMCFGPKRVAAREAETAGAVMAFFLSLGLALGAALSFLVRGLV
ncbi:hypothetical protein CRUP_022076 [Coryphaenoides rupestris]|nr:hypothetical protein CRUP_022076 [Coryphaenoides rupestris]